MTYENNGHVFWKHNFWKLRSCQYSRPPNSTIITWNILTRLHRQIQCFFFPSLTLKMPLQREWCPSAIPSSETQYCSHLFWWCVRVGTMRIFRDGAPSSSSQDRNHQIIIHRRLGSLPPLQSTALGWIPGRVGEVGRSSVCWEGTAPPGSWSCHQLSRFLIHYIWQPLELSSWEKSFIY